MKFSSKSIFSTIFAASLAFSVFGADVAHAKDVDNDLSFQGRVRGWYESSSTKANSDADSVSETKFQASSRLGVTGKTVKGDLTAKVKLEIEAHEQNTPGTVSTTARDAWVSAGNKSVDLKLGRQWMPDFGGNNTYSAMNSPEDTVGGLGRTEGGVLSIKTVPNLDLKFVYVDVVDGINDVTAYQPFVSYKVNDQVTLAANFTSKSVEENEDKGGDTDNRTDMNQFTVFGKAEIDQYAPYIGFESSSITEGKAGADDEDIGVTKLMVGIDAGLGNDMGVYVEYINTTEIPDEGDDVVTNNIAVALEKKIAHVELQVGYNNKTVSAGDNEEKDGAENNSIVAGFRYCF